MATITVTFDDGSTYTLDEDDLVGTDGLGYSEAVTVDGEEFDSRFVGYMWAFLRHGQALFRGFSTSSVAIGAGTKNFTITTYRPFFTSMRVRIVDAGNAANYMLATVVSYDADTGAFEVSVAVGDTGGSGTIDDWVIYGIGEQGAQGASTGYEYTFDLGTGGGDPGAGQWAANNADLTAATVIYINDAEVGGTNVAADLLTWDDSTSTVKGKLRVQSKLDPTDFVQYSVSAVTDQSGYVEVTVSHIVGSGTAPFAAGAESFVSFVATGNDGVDGDTGPTGSIGDLTAQPTASTLADDDLLVLYSDANERTETITVEEAKIVLGGMAVSAVSANVNPAVAGTRYVCDTSGGAFTITLPAAPSQGDRIGIADAGAGFEAEPLTIACNGNTIAGDASDLVCDLDTATFELLYIGSDWRIV